jgi:hypothetical protein
VLQLAEGPAHALMVTAVANTQYEPEHLITFTYLRSFLQFCIKRVVSNNTAVKCVAQLVGDVSVENKCLVT